MRLFITAVFILINVSVFGQIDSTDFKPATFKRFNSKEYNFDKITPATAYKYRQTVYNPTSSLGKDQMKKLQTVVSEVGNKKYARIAKKYRSQYGFFVDCHSGLCSYYIVAIRPDGKVDLINSDDKLKLFIGSVDNEEEAKLLARANGFPISTDTVIAGSYKERADDYLLYLYDYFPEDGSVGADGSWFIKSSVKAVLNKQGEFEVIDKTIFSEKKL